VVYFSYVKGELSEKPAIGTWNWNSQNTLYAVTTRKAA